MTSDSKKLVAQNPLIMRCHRLIEAFAKSDDERDFYVDRQEGFILYADLDKSQEELDELFDELTKNSDRYCLIPKLTFYEVKKVMENFVNEKVYDIDTKEKLIDIIQSKEARENFLEFVYDHHSELEKWQQYYQERFRVRIIEWLRNNQFDFVFEEDLELAKSVVEKLKLNTFQTKAGKDIVTARKILVAKAKTYYSSEALNPRPKRGRPPKQVAKVETEPQFSNDIYTTVPRTTKPFLFIPEYQGSSAIFTFSGRFSSEADLLAYRREQLQGSFSGVESESLQNKLNVLRTLSSGFYINEGKKGGGAAVEMYHHDATVNGTKKKAPIIDFSVDDEDDEEDEVPAKKSAKGMNTKQTEKAKKIETRSKNEPVAQAKKNSKSRLRPLVKKNATDKDEKAVAKKPKVAPLRKLRRSK